MTSMGHMNSTEQNMEGKRNFEVKVINDEVVAAALPMQEQRLQQSNLDLLLPPVSVGVFFCYKKPNEGSDWPFSSVVSALKKSLAQALVSYHVFAGEMVQNAAGEPEVLCNNRGVNFVKAFADVELQFLNLYNPDESVEGKLVPAKVHGLLAVQATQLKCGGMVVGCTFDHRVADAYSFNMFMVSWAEMARSVPLTTVASFQRSSISPRHPAGTFDSYVSKLFVPLPKLLPPAMSSSEGTDDHQQAPISRIYYIKSEQIIQLQSLANSHDEAQNGGVLTGGQPRTKLEAFSAFLWKIVASSEGTGDDKSCRLGIVVDGRNRLSCADDNDDENQTVSMSAYFGNVLTIPFDHKKNKELKERPLNWIANQVHEFIQNAATKNHFLELIDYVEAHRPAPMIAKIFVVSVNREEPAFVISSGQHFPVTKIDFGWGKPVFGSYHFPWGSQTGYVMPMLCAKGNGDWVVYMHLAKEQIEAIERHAAHVFAPLDPNHHLLV